MNVTIPHNEYIFCICTILDFRREIDGAPTICLGSKYFFTTNRTIALQTFYNSTSISRESCADCEVQFGSHYSAIIVFNWNNYINAYVLHENCHHGGEGVLGYTLSEYKGIDSPNVLDIANLPQSSDTQNSSDTLINYTLNGVFGSIQIYMCQSISITEGHSIGVHNTIDVIESIMRHNIEWEVWNNVEWLSYPPLEDLHYSSHRYSCCGDHVFGG